MAPAPFFFMAALLLPGLLLPGDAPPPALEIESHLEAGDLDGAIRTGEEAVAQSVSSSEVWDLLGRAYGLKAKESSLLEQIRLARRARACFEKAVTLDPSNVAARADLATYDMRAPAFLGGGREKARRQIEEVARLDPARGHELRGALAEREKDPARAEAQYRLAMAASAPGQHRARRALSTFLIGQRRFAEARRLWLEGLESDPADGVARYELAGVALASGEGLDEASRELEACLEGPEAPGGVRRGEVEKRLALVEQKLRDSAGSGRNRRR